jgi:hypothetical protein
MRKAIAFALPLLICSCGGENVASSSSEESQSVDKAAALSSFAESVNAVAGNPIAASVQVSTTRYYLSSGDPMTIEDSDSFEIKRYRRDDASVSALCERIGTYTVGSASSNYTTQLYGDGSKLYVLTSYESGEKSKDEYAYTEDGLEALLNISFAYTNEANVKTLSDRLDNDRFLIQYDLGDPISGDGTYAFSYSITQYQEASSSSSSSAASSTLRIPELYMGHSYEIKVSSGVIVESVDSYEYTLYVGGEKGNWLTSTTTSVYTQGDEYPLYEGDLFDPSEFSSDTSQASA